MSTGEYQLIHDGNYLKLQLPNPRLKPLVVDFLAGKAQHRRTFGGGRGQLIAKACGLKKYPNPTVLDVTAGLGQDAFVLACLGCDVTMLERAPMIAALVQDGLRRLNDPEIKLQLIEADAQDYLKTLGRKPDVIYLDPMYPDTTNTALAKKEMQVLRDLVGDDNDVKAVFRAVLSCAKKRVVVKRPRQGMQIDEREPDIVFCGKSSRFDVYLV